MLKLNNQQLKSFWQANRTTILIVGAALLLTIFLLAVRAGGPFAAFEAESANLAGNTVIKSEAGLSGGKYVEFSAEDPTAPPPPPSDPSSDYGAGADGSSLAVPGNAVSVNPSNIVSEINNRPAGTAFRLSDGTYKLGQLPNKSGNEYYGNPSDHTKVIFDGETTYSSLSQPNPGRSESTATSGKHYVWKLLDNNVIANMTIRRYRGSEDLPGGAPIESGGGSNTLVQNVEIKDNQFSGIRFGSSNWHVKFVTVRHNGQYAFSGGGGSHLVENFLVYEVGESGLNFVPRFEKSDRGASKIVHSTDFTFRKGEVRDIEDNGLWFDSDNNRGMLVENNYIHDVRRHGVIYEWGDGDGEIIRNNMIVNVAFGTPQQDYRDAGIFSNTGGPILIEGNTIDGARNGIVLYQPNRTIPAGSDPKICGTTIRNNTIKNIDNAWVGIHVAVTHNGCNPENNPGQVTIQNNNEQGSNIRYWFGGLVTPSQWAAKGYN